MRHTLPRDPLYAFCPAYGPPGQPQEIRIVFDGRPGYVPTAFVAADLDIAEFVCDKLNAKLGLSHDAWQAVMRRSMFAEHGSPGVLH